MKVKKQNQDSDMSDELGYLSAVQWMLIRMCSILIMRATKMLGFRKYLWKNERDWVQVRLWRWWRKPRLAGRNMIENLLRKNVRLTMLSASRLMICRKSTLKLKYVFDHSTNRRYRANAHWLRSLALYVYRLSCAMVTQVVAGQILIYCFILFVWCDISCCLLLVE